MGSPLGYPKAISGLPMWYQWVIHQLTLSTPRLLLGYPEASHWLPPVISLAYPYYTLANPVLPLSYPKYPQATPGYPLATPRLPQATKVFLILKNIWATPGLLLGYPGATPGLPRG